MNKKFIQQFREIIRIFDREIFFQNNASCCNGISLAQCHTLLEIEKNTEISVSELADKLSLDKSTVSRTIDGLVNISLVDRVIPKENRRKAILNLTDKGKQVCNSINYTHDTYIKNMLNDFTASEQEEFLRLFKKLTGNMINLRQEN
ncbi:MAG: MarR family transcriptional regulator [Bacteroidales bacterium]|nr:MarR family transcriptional regulator [Bacteroidales bacterium]